MPAFFFSSRRRHTRCYRDWSSDVCSSDLKKYEDIYPFDFETEQWEALWEELQSIVYFWIEQGVKVFRVDNPHTKPLRFWEWLIANVKRSEERRVGKECRYRRWRRDGKDRS